MFQILSFDDEVGSSTETESHSDLSSALSSLQKLHKKDKPHFVVWDNSESLTGEAEDASLQAVLEANEGRILRVTKNTKISFARLSDSRVCCGGPNTKCFCVIYSNGRKVCETTYCNANGYCWTVECSIPCGC